MNPRNYTFCIGIKTDLPVSIENPKLLGKFIVAYISFIQSCLVSPCKWESSARFCHIALPLHMQFWQWNFEYAEAWFHLSYKEESRCFSILEQLCVDSSQVCLCNVLYFSSCILALNFISYWCKFATVERFPQCFQDQKQHIPQLLDVPQ